MEGGVCTDRVRRNPGLCKLNRVADQPGFDATRIDLDVKLEGEQVGSFPEGLERARRRECEIVACVCLTG